jgi:hypothetical protein
VRRGPALLALSLGLGGCAADLAGPSALDGDCSAGEACPAGSVCASVGEGFYCTATEGRLGGLLLEVIPATGANASYFVELTELDASLDGTSASGVRAEVVVPVPPLVAVTPGRVHVDDTLLAEVPCAASDGSVPAQIELRRVAPYPGVLTQTFGASSTLDPQGDTYRFELLVPPGTYDVYVTPTACDPGAPALPPAFRPGQLIDASTALSITLPSPKRLAGVAKAPALANLTGWFLEVLEPGSGRLLSSPAALVQGSFDLYAPFDFDFGWIDTSYVPLVRLRPPIATGGDPSCAEACGGRCSYVGGACLEPGACLSDGDCLAGEVCADASCQQGGRPSVYWTLDGLAITGSTESVTLDVSTLDVSARQVSGRVVDFEGNPVIAAVTIESAALAGDWSNAAYTTSVETDADGVFSTFVPPGDYRATAVPTVSLELATAQRTWLVSAAPTCFCGQQLELPPRAGLVGRVLDTSGSPLSEGSVVARPSLESATFFEDALGATPPIPREAQGAIQSGTLDLRLDPGSYDLTLRAADAPGQAWLVKPGITVLTTDTGLDRDLGQLTLPLTVFLTGTLDAPSGTSLEGTVVRAWLPIAGAGRAIPVGEAVVKGGSFFLGLPAKVVQ